MKIISQNVNSVRLRLPAVSALLKKYQPDYFFMQEIKCEEALFPTEAFTEAGYFSYVSGQKSYNGVAILSRTPGLQVLTELPNAPLPVQARFSALTLGKDTLVNVYVPNGNSGGEEGYVYKIAWLKALNNYIRRLLQSGQNIFLAGDFNICPTAADYAPEALSPDDALLRLPSRAAYRELIGSGLSDCALLFKQIQAKNGSALLPSFTFWDYRGTAFQKNSGLRIDFILVSARPAENLKNFTVLSEERAKEKPSDHAPVYAEFSL